MSGRISIPGVAIAFSVLAWVVPGVARAVDLAGVTTITAPSSGVADIDVRAPVRLSTAIQANPTISMQGQGLAYGFVLEQSTPKSLGHYFAAFRVRPGGGCDGLCGDVFGQYLDTFSSMDSTGAPEEITVAPGRYRLGVLAPDGPVTITLRPAGVSGTSTITSLVPTPATAKVLPRLDDGSVPNTTRHGASAPLPTRGIMYYSQAAHYETAKVASQREFCDYEGEPTDPLAYAPSCPGGSGGPTGPGFVVPGAYSEYLYGFLRVVQPMTYGIGGNVTSASGGLTVGAVAAWLPLYPPEADDPFEDLVLAPPAQMPSRSLDMQTRPAEPQRLVVGKAKRRGRQVTVRVRCAATKRCSGQARAGKTARRFTVGAGKSLTLRLRARKGARITVRWRVADGRSGRAVRH